MSGLAGRATAPRGIVQSRGEGELEFGRVVAFSDGVIAIAITLLVLTLDVPNVPNGDLAEALGDQWRQYLAFVLSFALIGRFWIVHHRAFTLLERFDGTLMVLNLVFLALIVVMPFATDLVAEYEDDPVCIVVYASVVGLASLMTWLMIRYSLRSGHVRADMRPLAAAASSWSGLGPTAAFLVSAPVALLSAGAAFGLWLLTVPARASAPASEPARGAGETPEPAPERARASPPGGGAPSSTRSTRAASRTPTATASATCPGIIARLDHLNDGSERSLGVDAIWLSPFYPSPMADFGYDVADYTGVDRCSGRSRTSTACSARPTRAASR